MKRKRKNPNDHNIITPRTKGREADDRKFTSYDTSEKETSTPQKVREGSESSAELDRVKKGKT